MKKMAIFLAVVLSFPIDGRAQDKPARYSRRWFYASHNLLDDKQVERLLALIQRARQAGYNGVVLADDKFAVLDRMPEAYFSNAQRIRRAAREAQIEIIPSVFPIGYSGRLLAHDPNLAEGMPAVDIPFVVRGREAVLVQEPTARIANGDLERADGDRFSGFTLQDDPGKTTFADHRVVHGGTTSLRIEDDGRGNPNRNYRIAQRIRVRPHACYRFSAWVKTRLQHAR